MGNFSKRRVGPRLGVRSLIDTTSAGPELHPLAIDVNGQGIHGQGVEDGDVQLLQLGVRSKVLHIESDQSVNMCEL